MGATGYAGAELLRLAAPTPTWTSCVATGCASVGQRVATSVPALAAAIRDLVVDAPGANIRSSDLDVVFLSLPHGESQTYVPELRRRGVQVVDLGADFRLRTPLDYPPWYGQSTRRANCSRASVYGLVERHRKELVGAS